MSACTSASSRAASRCLSALFSRFIRSSLVDFRRDCRPRPHLSRTHGLDGSHSLRYCWTPWGSRSEAADVQLDIGCTSDVEWQVLWFRTAGAVWGPGPRTGMLQRRSLGVETQGHAVWGPACITPSCGGGRRFQLHGQQAAGEHAACPCQRTLTPARPGRVVITISWSQARRVHCQTRLTSKSERSLATLDCRCSFVICRAPSCALAASLAACAACRCTPRYLTGDHGGHEGLPILVEIFLVMGCRARPLRRRTPVSARRICDVSCKPCTLLAMACSHVCLRLPHP